ncbi:MAG: zinc-dependent metalloprotease [Actinobacteria bacterium]|nr:zinc-dependent metalloprotease [Actinomycetota bacterium]
MTAGEQSRSEKTLLGVVFDYVDSFARTFMSLMPLGKGIKNAIRYSGDGLISWDYSREVAVATLELQKDPPVVLSGDMVDQYQVMLRDSMKHIENYSGLAAVGMPEYVEVFTQQDWIGANIESFRFLFDTVSEKYIQFLEEVEVRGGVTKQERAHRMATRVLTIQVGIIMGYLARNVLGQFDLSLPDPERGSRLYLVETNLHRVQQKLGLHPRDFRQWITLHEVTHCYEFHCNDWLKEYVSSLMQDYLSTIDWSSLAKPGFLSNLRSSEVHEDDALRIGGLISIISTPEQRRILAQVQAVMSVLEGYSNHVMDTVGKELLPSYASMKERFERRREMKSGVEKLLQRLIGIDLKLQQYKLGQSFVDRVVEKENIEFLNRVWEGPGKMPTMEEVLEPELWVKRMKEKN